MAMSTIALHEITGNLWYRLRPQVAPASREPAGRGSVAEGGSSGRARSDTP
jgi:hypothetical protein